MIFKNIFRRGSALLLTAALLISLLLTLLALPFGGAAKPIEEINTDNANAIYIYNIENDRILYEKNADVRIQPVSTVKIMVGLIATEALSGQLDDLITITPQMIDGVAGQHYNIVAGHVLSARDLLYLAFCGGCHRSINVLAHVISGNVPNFISLMNAKAAELGMTDTLYTNVTGMHSEGMYTTVNDIVKLCLEASKNPLLMQITTADAHETEMLGEKNFVFENRNYLVGTGYTAKYFNKLCHGLAAGSTAESGYCVATIADDGNLSYLCVVMGASEDEDGTLHSYALANALIKWAYSDWGYVEVISSQMSVCEIPVTMSLDIDSVLVIPSQTVSIYLPKSSAIGNGITHSYSLNAEELQAPVSEGAHVGIITAYYEGKELVTVDLVTKTSVAQSEVLYSLMKIREISQNRIFKSSVIFAIIFILLYIVVKAFIRGYANNSRYRRLK